MFERALGPVWGFHVWRGLVVLAVLCMFGGAIFGLLHGIAVLRADYAPSLPSQSSASNSPAPISSDERPNPSADLPLSAPNSGKGIAEPMVGGTHNCEISGGTNNGIIKQDCR